MTSRRRARRALPRGRSTPTAPGGPAARHPRRGPPRQHAGHGVRRLVQRPPRPRRPRVRPPLRARRRDRQRNVAVDVARMLVPPREELAVTDIADHALGPWPTRGRRGVILGRRGPAQAAFTTPELRELGELIDADVVVDPAEVQPTRRRPPSSTPTPPTRQPREPREPHRVAEREPTGKPKRVELRFLRPPLEILGDGRVEASGRRQRVDRDDAGASAPATPPRPRRSNAVWSCARSATAAAGSTAFPSTQRAGVIPNERGRVSATAAAASGPLRRRLDQARPIRRDRHQQEGRAGDGRGAARGRRRRTLPEPRGRRRRAAELLAERGAHASSFAGWQAIDALDKCRGDAAARGSN